MPDQRELARWVRKNCSDRLRCVGRSGKWYCFTSKGWELFDLGGTLSFLEELLGSHFEEPLDTEVLKGVERILGGTLGGPDLWEELDEDVSLVSFGKEGVHELATLKRKVTSPGDMTSLATIPPDPSQEGLGGFFDEENYESFLDVCASAISGRAMEVAFLAGPTKSVETILDVVASAFGEYSQRIPDWEFLGRVDFPFIEAMKGRRLAIAETAKGMDDATVSRFTSGKRLNSSCFYGRSSIKPRFTLFVPSEGIPRFGGWSGADFWDRLVLLKAKEPGEGSKATGPGFLSEVLEHVPKLGREVRRTEWSKESSLEREKEEKGWE